MHFADEVLPPSSVGPRAATASKPPVKELRLATQIIDSLSADWRPSAYHDTYTEEVLDLIRRHAAGEDLSVEESAPSDDNKVTDLMEALQASLDANRKKAGAAGKPKKARAAAAKRGGVGSAAKKAGASPAKRAAS